MQIRCTTCTRTIGIDPDGELPPRCPLCAAPCVPERLGPYVPVRLIATGGMGEVYLARHTELGTEVALKLLPAMALEAATAVRERFAREARLTARIQHPGVVKVLGSEVAGDRPYLVLEFVDGETLRQRLQRGPLPIVEAARFVAATALVLAAAHAQGVLHRDVKPDNVMVNSRGEVRVLDFGIARAMTDDAPLTRTGEILGTPEYMAPEQLLDGPEATDQRTDVHALGVLLYELLTRHSPFHGANLFQALKLVEALVPQPPSKLRAEVPQALDAVVLRALQKRREDRWPSALDFAAAVRLAVPEAANPTTNPTAAPKPRLWPYLATAAATLLVTAILATVLVRQFLAPLVTTVFTAGAAGAGELEAAAAAVLPTRDHLQQWLAEGQWSLVLQRAEQAVGRGDRDALPIAREAFLFTHLVWPLAAGLPPWLGSCDERQRRRLFGDSLEDPLGMDGTGNAMVLLARGEAAAALRWLQDATLAHREVRSEYGSRHQERTRRRLLLLAAHLAGVDAASLRALEQQLDLPDDAAARLLGLSRRPSAERAQGLAEHAARLPIEQPEHWLARRCADACLAPAVPDLAEQHAELAWLHGAGELAVLLDAGLRTLHVPGVADRPVGGGDAQRLLRRVGIAEAADAPASVALGALLHWAMGQQEEAERALAALPNMATTSLRPFQQWRAATSGSDRAEVALQRGLAACRLGNDSAAQAQFAAAATPEATLCLWLLDRTREPNTLPPSLHDRAFEVAAELVRGDATQIARLLAAAAVPRAEQPHFLRLAVLAGAEPDFTVAPWSAYADGNARREFDEEVNGGFRR